MSSAFHREDPGSNPGKGRFFRIIMKDVTFELLRCSYSHIWCFILFDTELGTLAKTHTTTAREPSIYIFQ